MNRIPLQNNCKHQYGDQFSLGFPAKRGKSFSPKILHIFAFGLLAKMRQFSFFFVKIRCIMFRKRAKFSPNKKYCEGNMEEKLLITM